MLHVEKDQFSAASADRRRFFAALCAHGGARVLSKVASAPLERVKVCLQVSALPRSEVFAQGGKAGPLRVFTEIVYTQGARALWRGAGTHLCAAGLGGITRLGLLRTSQMWTMPGGDRRYKGLESYVRRCAFLYASGSAALVVAYPLDVAYTNLAADNGTPRNFRGFWHFVRTAAREHGLRSLYRGFPLCLATALPFVVVATGVHDGLAPHILHQQGRPPEVGHGAAQPGDLFWLVRDGAPAHLYPWNLILGAVAGFAGQVVTYPLDTLRRKWQHTCVASRTEVPRTLQECAWSLYAAGGARAFYAGFGVNAFKLIPEVLVLSGAYLFINAAPIFV